MAKENKNEKENKIDASFVDQRTFRYQQGSVSLSFTLAKRKDELQQFLELLKAAQGDVVAWMNDII